MSHPSGTDCDYEIRVVSDFDPDSPGLPPGDVVEAFEYAAATNGLSSEVWHLVDKDSGETLSTYSVGDS